MPKLILKRRAEILKEFELGGKAIYFLGTDPRNDFVINDQKVSIKHLKIENNDNQYYVEDLNSAFGTLLNGKPLHDRAQIVEGDELVIGGLSLIFENGVTPRWPKTETDDQVIEVIGEEDFPDQSTSPSDWFGKQHKPQQDTQEFYELEDFPDDAHPQANGTHTPSPTITTSGKSYYLLAIDGPYIGKRFALNHGDTKIGRDNTLNDIVIRNNADGALDPSISRRHATISYRNGKYYISDKRSKTRTYVNQIKLAPTEELPVQENDEIEIVSDQQSTIFRMLPDGNYDISPPKKTSVWWNRNKLRLGILVTSALGCLALAALGWSWNHRLTGSEKPDELRFIEETWYSVESNNGVEDQAAPALSSLALADFNGNDKIDLIFADQAGRLAAIDGMTKQTLWKSDDFMIKNTIPIVTSDLNTDEVQDVLVVGTDSRLRALDGSNGAEIWLSPILGETVSGAPTVADFNNDGFKDVLIAVTNGRIHLGTGDIYGIDWHTIETGLTIRSTPSSADWDGDGKVEIFVGSEEGKMLVIDGSTKKTAVAFDFNEEVSKATGTIFGEHHLRYPIALTDITCNQSVDLIVGATNGNYLALEGQSMERIWFESLPVVFTNNEPLSPVVSDFNNDGIEDVAVVSNQMLRIVQTNPEPKNRKNILWEYNLAGNDVFVSSPTLTDIDKDGISDLIISTRLGAILIFSGEDGQRIEQIDSQFNPVTTAILTGDIGGDGSLDMIFMRQDGHIYRIHSNSPVHKNSLVWGQTHGDERHSGNYSYEPPKPTATDMMSATLGLLAIAVGFMTFSSNKKRKRIIRKNQNA